MNEKDNCEGYCPYCNSTNIEYASTELSGEGLFREVNCLDCDKCFKEWYAIIYTATTYE